MNIKCVIEERDVDKEKVGIKVKRKRTERFGHWPSSAES